MRMCASELLCLGVHHVDVTIDGTADVFAYGITGFIRGIDQDAVKQFFQRQLLPGAQIHVGTICLIGIDRRLIDGDHFIKRTVLDRNETCHKFGDRGGEEFLVHIFCIQNSTGVGIHQNGSLCTDGRSLRPGRAVVALHRFVFSFFGFIQKILCGSICLYGQGGKS